MSTEKTLTNHRGETVPVKYVPAIDKHKDALAKKALRTGSDISAKLAAFKEQLLSACDATFEQMKESAEVRTGEKGNYSITSFDKSIKIEVSVHDRIEFDDNITFAQAKLKQFIGEKTKGVDHDILQLINNAFESRGGRLDAKRIFGLFKLNIKHPLWIEAMELIKKSISTNSTKRYIRIWQKNEKGEYKAVPLDFSGI